MYISLKSKVIGSDVSDGVSKWSPGDSGWSVEEKDGRTGKTTGDLMLF